MKPLINIYFQCLLLCLLSTPLIAQLPSATTNSLSLAGLWHFGLDEQEIGISYKGIGKDHLLPLTIQLPGSTDQANFGIRNLKMSSLRLTRPFTFKGTCWFEKEIFIPENWSKKSLFLFLERAHWQTEVFINGERAGKQASLSTPHYYNITNLLHVGQVNKIRIGVNNNLIYDIGTPHAISEETQTNWNGIIGKIKIKAMDPVHIQSMQVYPNIEKHLLDLKITINNQTKEQIDGQLKIKIDSTHAPFRLLDCPGKPNSKERIH